MNTTPQILPAFFVGADASPGPLAISGAEAWASLAAIASVVLVAIAGCGWAVWFTAANI